MHAITDEAKGKMKGRPTIRGKRTGGGKRLQTIRQERGLKGKPERNTKQGRPTVFAFLEQGVGSKGLTRDTKTLVKRGERREGKQNVTPFVDPHSGRKVV